MVDCRRGEIWQVEFDPQLGAEIQKRRPALVVSVDQLNRSPAGIVIVIPGTSTALENPKTGELLFGYCKVEPTTLNGLKKTTYFVAQQIKSASVLRLVNKMGVLESSYRKTIADRVAQLLGLYEDLPE